MTKVLKIELIPGYKNSYRVYFDDDTQIRCFTKNILDFSLEPGKILDDVSYDELKAAVSESLTRERAARLLSQRQMSEKELELNLIKKGEPEEYAQRAVAWLRDLGALDDSAYASSIVRYYAKKGFGMAKIKDELFKRYIPRELWEEALEHMPDCDEAVKRIIASKLKGTKPDRKELKKVSDALYRRGFSWDEIRDAIKRYEADLDQEDT